MPARGGGQSVVILLTDGTPNEPSGSNPVIAALGAMVIFAIAMLTLIRRRAANTLPV